MRRDGITRDGRNDYFYCQSFDTAGSLFEVFDSNQKSIIVPYNDEAKDIIALLRSESVRNDLTILDKVLKKAKDYTVSIFEYSFTTLLKSDAIMQIEELGVFCLKDEYYDDNIGVSTKEVKECDTLML